MPLYNFKAIKVVPTGKDFVDIVLSKTQRQTPTVVHNGWSINRIRQFYMRKVKYTQQSWHEKLSTVCHHQQDMHYCPCFGAAKFKGLYSPQILEDFPKVDDIHPFYADLLNVLYDRDHYKLALGQLNMARNLIDRVSQGLHSSAYLGTASRFLGLSTCDLSMCRLRTPAEVWGLLVPLQRAEASSSGESWLFVRHHIVNLYRCIQVLPSEKGVAVAAVQQSSCSTSA